MSGALALGAVYAARRLLSVTHSNDVAAYAA